VLLRRGASTRFQPKRRASTDHNPGPNMARAAPAVANSSQTHLSPGSASTFQISITATPVPAMGVHKPAMSKTPANIKRTDVTVTFIGEPPEILELARTISAEPMTRRSRTRPIPGQPPANVEYKRRNMEPVAFLPLINVLYLATKRSPKKRGRDPSFEA